MDGSKEPGDATVKKYGYWDDLSEDEKADLIMTMGGPGDNDGLSGREVRAIIEATLADLDRKWKVPPVVFIREMARQIVQAISEEPQLLLPVMRLYDSVLEGKAIIALLRMKGVHVRLKKGKPVAGPVEAITDEVKFLLSMHRNHILDALLCESKPEDR